MSPAMIVGLIFAAIFAMFSGLLMLAEIFNPQQILIILISGFIGLEIGKGFCGIGSKRKRRSGP